MRCATCPPGSRYWPYLVLLLTYAVVLEYTVRSRDWFYWYPYIDNLMHIGWGAVIALAIVVCWRNDARFILIAVVIWQVLWEAGEMVMDRVNNDPPHMRDYPFPDGVIDTCMDLIGAGIVLWLTRKSRPRKSPEIPEITETP